MTDYGAPTTPGAAMRDLAGRFEYLAGRSRREAEKHLAEAATWDEAATKARHDAASYDRWQPEPDDTAAADRENRKGEGNRDE